MPDRRLRDRFAAAWCVFTAPAPPAEPAVGERVLEVSVGGRFFVRVPEHLDEGDPAWEAWFDDAIAAASLDGRWDDCTDIEDVQVGVLDERGHVIVPPRPT